MSDISKIKVPINGTPTAYDIKDTTARTHISDTNVHVTAADKTNWNAKSELALGETNSTAYRGDRGKIAYTHATETKSGQVAAGLYKVGSTAQGHISALTAVEKADITALGIPGSDTNTVPSAYCSTAAGTAAKTAVCTDFTLTANTYLHVLIKNANTNDAKLTLNVNSTGAKNIWINGVVTKAGNSTLPAGSYIAYYDGSKYLFRTDGKLVTADLIAGLANVATSGSYNDLSDQPTIPTVNNAKLTIQRNGTTVKTFTANASTDVTANIAVPTKTSDLSNDSGFVTTDENVTQNASVTTDANYRVMLSASATNNEETGHVNKSGELYFNPSTGRLRCKRFAIENNEASTVYPLTINLNGRGPNGTPGDDIRPMVIFYQTKDTAGNTQGRTAYPIGVIGNNATNTNNTGVRLGSHNGTTIVGAGESSVTFASAQSKYNDEGLYLTADGNVELYSGLSNDSTTFGGHVKMNSSGNVTIDSANGVVNSDNDYNYMVIGNDKGVGVTGHKGGRLFLYSDVLNSDINTSYGSTLTPGNLTANRTHTLPDMTGTLLVKNSNSCLIGDQSSQVSTNKWYKVASWENISTNNYDHTSMIAISNCFTNGSTSNQNAGLLYVHFRVTKPSGANWTIQHANMNFVANKGFNTQHFVLVWSGNSNNVTCSLYTYIEVRYMTRRFTFLDDGHRTDNNSTAVYSDNSYKESDPTGSAAGYVYAS